MLSIFLLIFCRSDFQYRNGGDWGVLPGPTNPWYQAGSPVQCWYQHFGARPEPCWQHDQQEQKFWEYITDSRAWIGRLSGVLWHWCEFLPSLFYLIPTRPPARISLQFFHTSLHHVLSALIAAIACAWAGDSCLISFGAKIPPSLRRLIWATWCNSPGCFIEPELWLLCSSS